MNRMRPIQPDEAISWDELVKLTPIPRGFPTVKDAEQPTLPFYEEKRGSQSRFKVPPTFPKGKDTLESADGRLA